MERALRLSDRAVASMPNAPPWKLFVNTKFNKNWQKYAIRTNIQLGVSARLTTKKPPKKPAQIDRATPPPQPRPRHTAESNPLTRTSHPFVTLSHLQERNPMHSAIHPLSTDTNFPAMRRRAFARLAIGGAAALALSACGGGGGDGDSSGDSSEPLRVAYEKLTPGLTHPEVLAMVDFAPKRNNRGNLNWQRGSESLDVSFNVLEPGSPATATVAIWSGSNGRNEQRSLTGI